MQPSNDPFILPLLCLGLIALILAIRFVVLGMRRRAWSRLAERTGLLFTPGNFFGRGMSVSGVYRSHSLILDIFVSRSGRSSSTCTRIVLPVAGAPPDFSLWIFTEGIFSSLGKLLGMQDIQTGDEDLDKRFLIRGNPEGDVVRLLTSSRLRQPLLAAPSFQMRLEKGEINFQKLGIVTNNDRLVELFDLLVALAGEVNQITS